MPIRNSMISQNDFLILELKRTFKSTFKNYTYIFGKKENIPSSSTEAAIVITDLL